MKAMFIVGKIQLAIFIFLLINIYIFNNLSIKNNLFY